MARLFACGFFVDPASGRLLLQLRDGLTSVNPHKWGFFGGSGEGAETPVQCFKREIKEELDVRVTDDEIVPLYRYLNPRTATDRNVFCVHRHLTDEEIALGEGADYAWIEPDEVFDLDLSEGTRIDLERFLGPPIEPHPFEVASGRGTREGSKRRET